MSSPKVYFITKDGKFYNSKDKIFYSNIVNANYDKNKKGIDFHRKTMRTNTNN